MDIAYNKKLGKLRRVKMEDKSIAWDETTLSVTSRQPFHLCDALVTEIFQNFLWSRVSQSLTDNEALNRGESTCRDNSNVMVSKMG